MTENFIFFWKGPFSQWFHSPMEVDGIKFVTCEQYMMYRKAIVFNDTHTAQMILDTDDPHQQKKLGRIVTPFDDDYWSSIADDIVYYGNKAKFTQNAVLHAALLATEGSTLVECCPYDTRWGIGLSQDDERALNRATWRGENRLGFILTRLRDELQGECNAEIDRSGI